MAGKYLSETSKQELRRQRTRRRTAGNILLRVGIALAVAVVILLNVFTQLVQVVHYTGSSMEPNLSSGQTLVIHKTQNVSDGDVIAFYYNNQILVRRVIAAGGDQISIEDDGTVSVNGQILDEPYLAARSIGQCNIDFPYLVPSGSVFVMGDNRVIAMDSRLQELGCVPMDRIIGKVMFVN